MHHRQNWPNALSGGAGAKNAETDGADGTLNPLSAR